MSDRILSVSMSDDFEGPWVPHEMTWDALAKDLNLPNPAGHKKCGCWVGGRLSTRKTRSRDTVVHRSVLTLDADSAPEDLPERAAAVLWGAVAGHTTYRHDPEKAREEGKKADQRWRWRIVAPLSRDVSVEEYSLIARAVMMDLGWQYFDKGSAEPERLMYRPSASDPDVYWNRFINGGETDADAWLTRAKELGLEYAPDREPFIYNGSIREPLLGVHPYAAAAIQRELARLRAEEDKGWDGEGWNNVTFGVSCNLVEFANSGWAGYSHEQALADLLEHAPTDEDFGEREHTVCFSNAESQVNGGGRACPDTTPEDDFAEMWVDDGFWGATPVLSHIRQAAYCRGRSALPLLGAVIVHVLMEAPIELLLPGGEDGGVGRRASLNIGVNAVGGTGKGKTDAVSIAEDLFEDSRPPQTPGSGEAMLEAFLTVDPFTKDLVLRDDPRALFVYDEVEHMMVMKARSGSSMGPIVRSLLVGAHTGASTVEKKRNLPKNSYRACMIVGVQPESSHHFLSDTAEGLPQRFLWLPVLDKSIPPPGQRPVSPGPLTWFGDLLFNVHEQRVVEFEPEILLEIQWADYARVTSDEESDPNSHAGLMRMKVASALAFLHTELVVTRQWWDLAGVLTDASAREIARCQAVLASKRVNVKTGSLKAAYVAEDDVVQEYIDKAVKRAADVAMRAHGEWVDWEHARPSYVMRNRLGAEGIEEVKDRLRAQRDLEINEDPTSRGTPAFRIRYVG